MAIEYVLSEKRKRVGDFPLDKVGHLSAAMATGSQTGEKGGEYPRSRLMISSTVIPPWRAVARISIRFPAPSLPTI